MKYKVGDKVRVRKDLVAYKEYICDGKLLRTNGIMAHMKGGILTIKRVNEVDKDYMVKENEWYWNDEMFEPVITNLDKVKEEIDIKDVSKIGNPFCQAIHRVRDEENCIGMRCDECAKWLKQPYKEPSILDEAEKKYLSNVIRPWRDKVKWIVKMGTCGNQEYIKICLEDEGTNLPNFKKNTIYKGMKSYKEYSLDELGL